MISKNLDFHLLMRTLSHSEEEISSDQQVHLRVLLLELGLSNNNALTSQTVTVVAKDSSGNNRNTGGDLFYIKVDNKSTWTSAFSCSLVAGAPTTITTPIFTLMTDLGNGNYTYSYTVNINGYLTGKNLILPYLTFSSPSKRPSLCQTRRGQDKGYFYFPQIYILKKIWK